VNPANTRDSITSGMKDSRWPKEDGWVKMKQEVDDIEIHYVWNERTGWEDEFKFKDWMGLP
jgi:hypothetical protein